LKLIFLLSFKTDNQIQEKGAASLSNLIRNNLNIELIDAQGEKKKQLSFYFLINL